MTELWSRPTRNTRYLIVALIMAYHLFVLLSRSQVTNAVKPWSPSGSDSLYSPESPLQVTNILPNKSVSSGSDGQLMAVIIETEITDNLIPVMLHFTNVLGPTWTVVLFTLEAKWSMPSSVPFRRAVADEKINIRFLPPETALKDSGSVSRLLASPWLWEQVESAQRILLFQTDSIICSKSSSTMDDFLKYDFIGAPISEQFGQGYNGGLSLRNPKLFLRVTKESDFQASGAQFEDQWFFQELKARDSVELPSADIAKTFSVETIYYETPLGYHQPARWQVEKMGDIERWCPEVKMLVGRRAV